MDCAASLPGYAKRISCAGGHWQRWWLHLILRMTVKRIPIIDVDFEQVRAQQAGFETRLARVDPQTQRTPVDCGNVAAEWVDVPESRPERVLLYFHGGAFVFRFPTLHAGMVSGWCRRLGARALMVDYRLAPEHPFPAAPDDCLAVYRWLLAQGHEPCNIVFGGDSAGGNLVLATLHRIKAVGEPMPSCAVVLSPVVDFTLSSRSIVVNAKRDPMFALSGLIALRGYYSPPERFLDPAVSPLFGDFRGFPPLLFQVGDIEVLLDESIRAAARAHAAGVQVELEIWDRMGHVFQAMASLPQAEAAAGNIAEFIARRNAWH